MMVRLKRWIGVLVMATGLAGCGEVFGDDGDDLRLSIGQITNGEAPLYQVQFTVRNAGSRLLYLPNCGERVLVRTERREPAGWQTYVNDACPLSAVWAPIAIRPGQRITSTVWMYDPGEYRLQLSAAPDTSSAFTPIAASGQFAIHAP